MKTIFTNRFLKPTDTLVIFAPSLKKGEKVKVVNGNNLFPFLEGICTGGIKALMTPSKGGKVANAYKGYREIKVKE